MLLYLGIGYIWHLRFGVPLRGHLFPFSLLPTAVLLFALILLHEMLHAVVFPGFPRSRDCMIGLWPSRFLFYAHYEGELRRERFLLVLLFPLLLISVVPLLVALCFGLPSKFIISVTTLNAMGASGDIIGVLLVSRQIPPRAVLRNLGWKTYWRPEGIPPSPPTPRPGELE